MTYIHDFTAECKGNRIVLRWRWSEALEDKFAKIRIWYCKQQNTDESTHTGTEFTAGEQVRVVGELQEYSRELYGEHGIYSFTFEVFSGNNGELMERSIWDNIALGNPVDFFYTWKKNKNIDCIEFNAAESLWIPSGTVCVEIGRIKHILPYAIGNGSRLGFVRNANREQLKISVHEPYNKIFKIKRK